MTAGNRNMLLLFSALVLAGCAVGPDYKEPKMQVDPAFSNVDQDRYSSDPSIGIWWHEFQDPMLDRLVDQAIRHNQDIRIAEARLREARALRSQAEFDYLPTITSNSSYNNSLQSIGKTPAFQLNRHQRSNELYNSGFDASWELDFFGRVRRSNEAQSAEYQAAEASRRDVLVTVTSEVARNYFELRGRQNQLHVAQRNAENQMTTVQLTQSMLDGGRGTELDVSRASAQLSRTKSIIPPIETAIKRAMHRISVLTGQLPTALEKELSIDSPIPPLPALVAIGKPEDLLRRRPDIRMAERGLAADTARVGIAIADMFPRVTFNGNFAIEAQSLVGLGRSGTDTFSFGPRISWAAFDLGRVHDRVKASRARVDAALALYEKTVLVALEDTENALVDFSKQLERQKYLGDTVRSSEKALNLARERYRGGINDFLTVLDAERTVLEAQDQFAQSQTSTATALIALYKELGGGWQIPPADGGSSEKR